MDIKLTKDAEYLIKVLYARYLDQRQYGKSKFDSAYFGSSENICNTFFALWSIEDLDSALIELGRSGLVENQYADDTVEHCLLTTDGIIYMENAFGRKLESVLKYIEPISVVKGLLS